MMIVGFAPGLILGYDLLFGSTTSFKIRIRRNSKTCLDSGQRGDRIRVWDSNYVIVFKQRNLLTFSSLCLLPASSGNLVKILCETLSRLTFGSYIMVPGFALTNYGQRDPRMSSCGCSCAWVFQRKRHTVEHMVIYMSEYRRGNQLCGTAAKGCAW